MPVNPMNLQRFLSVHFDSIQARWLEPLLACFWLSTVELLEYILADGQAKAGRIIGRLLGVLGNCDSPSISRNLKAYMRVDRRDQLGTKWCFR